MHFKYALFLLPFILALVTIFSRLGDYSINHHSDEIIHVRVVQEIVSEGNWFPLTHGGRAYLNKPPLQFWFSAVAAHLLGESNFSYRIVSALCGFTLLIIVSMWLLLSERLYAASIYAPIVLLSMIAWIHGKHGIREATQDAALVLLIFSSQILWLRAVNKNSWKLACVSGSLAGLACLTKSIAGALAPISILVLILLRRSWKDYRPFSIYALACLVPCGLYLAALQQQIPSFANVMFGREILERFQVGMHNADSPWLYLEELAGSILTPAPIVPCAVLITVLIGQVILAVRGVAQARIYLVFFLTPVILFSLLPSRQPWYIAPALPWLAIMISAQCEHWFKQVHTAALACVVSIFIAWQCGHSVLRSLYHSRVRLQLDFLQEEVRSRQGNLLIYASSFTESANPSRGRFNVEAIYTRMLRTQRTIVDDEKEFKKHFCTSRYTDILVEDNVYSADLVKINLIPAFAARKNAFVRLSPHKIPHEYCDLTIISK